MNLSRIGVRETLAVLFVVALLQAPLFIKSRYIINLLDIILVFTIYASAWNFFAYAGQGSLGHATFLGVGAYASMLTAKSLGVWPPLAVLVGGVAAVLVGVIVGAACVRLREWFLGMVTFGFSVICDVIVAEPLAWLTQGRFGVWAPRLVSPKTPNYYVYEYYIIAFSALATLLILYRLMNSRFGLGLAAIRENELAARAMGIPATRYKFFALLVSAFFSGIAGALLAHTVLGGYVSPEIFGVHYSFNPIIYSVAGGLGTIEGPVLGTFLVIAVWESLRILGSYQRFVVVGALLILIVIFIPEGIAPTLRKRLARLLVSQTSPR